jgi:hypothetical protein
MAWQPFSACSRVIRWATAGRELQLKPDGDRVPTLQVALSPVNLV